MSDPDKARKEALQTIVYDPTTTPQEKLDACNELRDLQDPVLTAQLARAMADYALEMFMELVQTIEDSHDRQMLLEEIERFEHDREAWVRKLQRRE